MGDTAPCTITIYACPPEAVGTILGGFEGHYFGTDWGGGMQNLPELVLGQAYVNDQASLGVDYEFADLLQKLGCIAVLAQDAKYEYDGAVSYTHPDLGSYRTTGGQNGGVLVPASEIDLALQSFYDSGMTDGNDTVLGRPVWALITALKQLSGKAWRDEVDRLEQELAENPITLPRVEEEEEEEEEGEAQS